MLGRKVRNLNPKRPYEGWPVPIIGHAAATMPEAMGAMTPVLIIDTTNRPDIDEYVRIHEHSGAGDVKTQWGRRPDNNSIYQLILEVIRPVDLMIYFEFSFPEQMSAIDHIVLSKKLCLQPGRPGDRLSTTFENSRRVIMEIPETGFGQTWNKRLHKYFERHFRREGMKREKCVSEAAQFIAVRRMLFNYRMSDL